MTDDGAPTALTPRASGERRTWQNALYIPLTILAWLAVLAIAGWLLEHVGKTILTLILSGVLAFALTPLVTFLSRWMSRTIAIAVAYTLGFGVLFALIAFLVATAAAQITTLVQNLPVYAKDIEHLEPQVVRLLHPFGVTTASFKHAQQQVLNQLQGVGTAAAKDSLGIITGVFGTIIDIILVLILSVYLTANGPRLRVWLRRQTPAEQRGYTVLATTVITRIVGGYIRGTLTLALLIGFMVGIGMLILGVPYAVLLGVLAFIMEFIPVIGVLISGAVCIVLALFQGWVRALLVLGYFVVVHIIEGDVVGPRIMGKAVGIHPAMSLVALVAATEVFGFWGALFAAPLAGLVQAFIIAVWKELHPAQIDAAKAVANAEEAKLQSRAGMGPAAQ
jgi:predicted PurR-regulated permease PerM